MGRKPADYTGKKYNMLTAIRRLDTKVCRQYQWEWECECGNLIATLPGHVKSGSTKSCGCQIAKNSAIQPGKKFGYLTAIHKTQNKSFNAYKWLFKCDCGKEVELSPSAVLGTQKSCGCKQHGECNQIHGGHSSPEYGCWRQMKSRCKGNDEVSRRHYLLRSIAIDERWESFENFLRDMGPRPSPLHSIDRINNNLGYFPENCRWATQGQQMANTRRSIRVIANGEVHCLKHACQITGANYERIRSRVRRGIPAQQAFDMG